MKFSLIVGYYRNEGMLKHQLSVWDSYPQHLREQVEIIVVDDGSPDMPAYPILKDRTDIKLYRIKEDVPWNQVMARNLGAYEATNDWIFFLDIDHVIPPQTLEFILSIEHLYPEEYYIFDRLKVTSLSPYKHRLVNPSHCLFLINRKTFLDIGAYDEDFCGSYGYSDAWLKHRMKNILQVRWHQRYLQCFMYTVIPQANDMSRERDKKFNLGIYRAKMNGTVKHNNKHLRLPWERLI